MWSTAAAILRNSPQGAVHLKQVSVLLKSASFFFKVEDVPLVEFMYLVFTRMPGESYSRRLRSL